ncbi:hypothetical protein Cabys_4110 [Caldithrix abyssi DSM 13497]|uniref:Uncharacterized protein n=1 Tax=Caldithrix abyssi DSM 13497 TaxID=880073 RepID=A0A1J1CDV1_CALAY|nr:hypothetical protein Cabys_4110 [Caldithrix abyssi DSM 13497]
MLLAWRRFVWYFVTGRLTQFVQAFNRSLNQTPKRGRCFERFV